MGQIKDNLAERTDVILFADVDREAFHVLGVFDHSVFAPNSEEFERFGEALELYRYRPRQEGTISIDARLTTSGHSTSAMHYVMHCMRVINDVEPRLDNQKFVISIWLKEMELPEKSSFVWRMDFMDLCVWEQTSNVKLIFVKGWT